MQLQGITREGITDSSLRRERIINICRWVAFKDSRIVRSFMTELESNLNKKFLPLERILEGSTVMEYSNV